MLPAFLGLSGPLLTDAERGLIRDANPAGFILFARNVEDPAQLRALTDALRDAAGRTDLPILIDQEGGRVARLRPPHWPAFPAPWRFAELYEKAPISAIEAARVNALAIALTLARMGINVDCTPLLDVRHPDAHDIIGDRALGAEPMRVAALGRAVLDGLAAGGVAGVIKHLPGHGRAPADSHEELPVVDAPAANLATDLAPFRALAKVAPMAMTAHVLYPAWDAGQPATLSARIIAEVIRGEIGFEGLLMSDDIAMYALPGPIADRATAALKAGCDIVLHCSGEAADNEAIAGALGPIGETASARLEKAMAETGKAAAVDVDGLIARRDALLAYA